METPKTVNNAPQEENPMSIRDIWNLCISHWKWFVLSVAVCLAAAAFYILKTVPVYSRSSSVLIKEDRRSGSVSADIASAFSDLGVGQTWVNVGNELHLARPADAGGQEPESERELHPRRILP